MALSSKRVAVATTAVQVNTDPTDRAPQQTCTITNAGPNTAYLGASDVTDTTGYPLASSATTTLTLDHDEDVFAICAAAESATLQVLERGI